MKRPRARGVGETVAVGMIVASMLGAVSGATFASFTATAFSIGPTVSTKRIFPGTRTSAAFNIADASGGGTGPATDASSPFAAAGDGLTVLTSAWAAGFAAGRYFDAKFSSPLPGNVPVTNAVVTIVVTPTSGTACAYFEVLSPAAVVLATLGSPAAPYGGCFSATKTFTLTVPQVVSTDQANDLVVRTYANSTTGAALTVDQATVSVTTPYQTTTLYPVQTTDSASGTSAAPLPWSVAAADGTAYRNQGNWSKNLALDQLLIYTFPAFTPPGATVTGATWTHSFKDANNNSQCYQFDVYAGATRIGQHPAVCNPDSFYLTNTVALPEITTAAYANGISVRVYGSNNGGSKRSLDDVVTLGISYYLD